MFGVKPILGTVALLESVKRSLHLLQLVAAHQNGDEIKMVTFFQLIDETSLRTLARQCRRQQLASSGTDTQPATVSIPEPAPPAVAPTVFSSAKRQRSAPNVNDPELVAGSVNDPQDNLGAFLDAFDFGDFFQLVDKVGEYSGG